MTPWPRKLFHFPIILIAIVQEFVWASALAWDERVMKVTAISVLSKFMSHDLLIVCLLGTAILAASGFFMARRINTLLALVPQQFLLYISAGSALAAVINGRFADGVMRSHAFLLADQSAAFLIAIFHTWAMILILHHAED